MTDTQINAGINEYRGKLNVKQLSFVRSIRLGHNQYDAYRGAGYASKSRAACDVAASVLIRNVKIKYLLALYAERNRRVEDIDRNYLLSALRETLELAREQGDKVEVRKCAAELAKLEDQYPASRQQLQAIVTHDAPLADFSQDEWWALFEMRARTDADPVRH